MQKQFSDYSYYIYKSRYAKWNEEEQRREEWNETVARYCDFWKSRFPDTFPYDSIYNSIYELETVPSMRCLMTAGPALARDEIAGYNCSYVAVDHERVFSEIMYVLMCGTGVGFSVERQYVSKLPEVAEEFHETQTNIIVADSRTGWASSFRELISLLYSGRLPKWDLSRLRPAGAILKTFGGRSSGPEPLRSLFEFTTRVFKQAAGRKLTSLECHDIICKIADIVVVGGVRRSALISLSNLSDDRLRSAKNGQWWIDHPERALANNSAAYAEKPDLSLFLKEWMSLYESKSGERGIFNRTAALKQAESSGRRESEGWEFGTNPCGEIVLRPNGLCNLSEVVVRERDTLDDLKRKVGLATIIGTFQSTLTSFRYVRPIWSKNAKEERLLGVSFTGIMDHPVLSGREGSYLGPWLTELKQHAIKVNQEWAAKIGIEPSVAITCVKPSGTVSQLVDSASGIHPRYSEYYLRTVRADKKDPIAKFLRQQGVYVEDDITKPEAVDVFHFPQKAPSGAVLRNNFDAISQLEHSLLFRKHWCEHNPSLTVYYRDREFLDVGAWVYKHFDDLGGVSFLPHSDHIYRQAPYQELTEEQYKEWLTKTPTIKWEELKDFETTDNTSVQPELACSAATGCEI